MKKKFGMTAAALILILAACGSPAQVSAPPTQSAPIFSAPGVVVASAESQPAQESNLSFAISAPVKQIMVKEGEAVTAGQLLMTIYAPELEGEVTQAELAEKAAALEYTYWIPHRFDRPPEREWQAKAEWDQKITELEIARASFAQASIYAPFDGVVVEVKIQAGEFAKSGEPVITLADVAHMQIVTTDLSERDAPRVQIGQSANVYIEALGKQVSGKVIRVAPKSQIIGGDVVYPVTIALDEQPNGLRWGMSAEVEIKTE